MNYPSKKIMWMIIAAAILVGAAFAYAQYSSTQSAASGAPAVSIDASPAADAPISSSGDWQKTLLGVDPGVARGSAGSLAPKASAASQNLTETDRLGQALFTQYAQLEKAGLATDQNSINAAVSQILNGSAVFTAPKLYALSELNVASASDSDSLRIYADSIAKLFQAYDSKQGSEITIVQQAIGGGNPDALKDIDPIISDYQAIVSSLVAMPAPVAAASQHRAIVNSMSMILATAKLLRHSDVDPVSGLQAVAQYPAGINNLANAFNSLADVLNAAHISFTAADPGAILLNKLPKPELPPQSATFNPQ